MNESTNGLESTKGPDNVKPQPARHDAVVPERRHDPALLKKRLDDICEGLREAIDREVARLHREGLPIYVSDNGKVVDLQQRRR